MRVLFIFILSHCAASVDNGCLILEQLTILVSVLAQNLQLLNLG